MPPIFKAADTGVSLQFYLHIQDATLKQRLSELVQKNGGMTVQKFRPEGCLPLVDPAVPNGLPQTIKTYSYKYIDDCASKKSLLELSEYLVVPVVSKPTTVVAAAAPAPAEPAAEVPVPSGGGRMKYTLEEDRAIYHYIKENGGGKATGNDIWKEAEARGLTSHSWQSMKSRFKDQINTIKFRRQMDAEEANAAAAATERPLHAATSTATSSSSTAATTTVVASSAAIDEAAGGHGKRGEKRAREEDPAETDEERQNIKRIRRTVEYLSKEIDTDLDPSSRLLVAIHALGKYDGHVGRAREYLLHGMAPVVALSSFTPAKREEEVQRRITARIVGLQTATGTPSATVARDALIDHSCNFDAAFAFLRPRDVSRI